MSKTSKHIRSENIDKIYRIFNKIVNRFPQTFPRVALVVHTSLDDLQQYYINTEGKEPPEDLPFAFCDGNTYTVHVHLTMNDETLHDITWYFLHELGHLYAHHKYGDRDPKWTDFKIAESYANRFANRWLKKLKEEGKLRL